MRTQEVKEVADFIKKAAEHLRDTDEACCFNYKLPGGEYVIAVGWLDGYDPDDKGYIHSKSQPTYCVDVGIKVRNDGDCADYQFLDMPWHEDGEVYDTENSLSEEEDYTHLASYLIKEFVNIDRLRNSGKLFNHTYEYWDEEDQCWYRKERN